jgi:glycosyltransferase involved in cell wall biosynthesis
MHQYTADLANRLSANHEVILFSTTTLPRDRYGDGVQFYTPLTTSNTGFSREGLRLGAMRRVWQGVIALRPDIVHFTGPYLWNVLLARRFRKEGIPTIHTLHDMDPHRGTHFKMLVPFWNELILRSVDHVLVHGERYRARLLRRGLPADRVTYTPLMHLFVSYERDLTLAELERCESLRCSYEPFMLFFGRLEHYKGIDYLLTAYAELSSPPGNGEDGRPRVGELVLAGPGDLSGMWAGELPRGVTVRNRLIGDEEAVDLFRRCSLVVLPYVDATQSALIPAAYFFHKPVVASRAGALAEYVEAGKTGLIVEPDHPPSLARALSSVLANPERLHQMGEAGHDWYRLRRKQEAGALFSLYSRVAADGLVARRGVARQTSPAE